MHWIRILYNAKDEDATRKAIIKLTKDIKQTKGVDINNQTQVREFINSFETNEFIIVNAESLFAKLDQLKSQQFRGLTQEERWVARILFHILQESQKPGLKKEILKIKEDISTLESEVKLFISKTENSSKLPDNFFDSSNLRMRIIGLRKQLLKHHQFLEEQLTKKKDWILFEIKREIEASLFKLGEIDSLLHEKVEVREFVVLRDGLIQGCSMLDKKIGFYQESLPRDLTLLRSAREDVLTQIKLLDQMIVTQRKRDEALEDYAGYVINSYGIFHKKIMFKLEAYDKERGYFTKLKERILDTLGFRNKKSSKGVLLDATSSMSSFFSIAARKHQAQFKSISPELIDLFAAVRSFTSDEDPSYANKAAIKQICRLFLSLYDHDTENVKQEKSKILLLDGAKLKSDILSQLKIHKFESQDIIRLCEIIELAKKWDVFYASRLPLTEFSTNVQILITPKKPNSKSTKQLNPDDNREVDEKEKDPKETILPIGKPS